ncbi:hypothetical protein, partial [Saccharomonospora halophila]|uniref:hypothetical protein n=1 Tax=Saccharomonospora halophila TaxID=129922 RepID=UPI0018DE6FF2
MLFLVLLLVLAALGLVVAALVTAGSLWAWISIGLSAVAGLLLVVDWRRGRTGPDIASAGTAETDGATGDSDQAKTVDPAETDDPAETTETTESPGTANAEPAGAPDPAGTSGTTETDVTDGAESTGAADDTATDDTGAADRTK